MRPAKDLGNRHVCWKCGAKFYDLNKPSPTCPKCGSDPRESPALKPAPKASKHAPVKAVPKDEEESREIGDEAFEDAEETEEDEATDGEAEEEELY